MKGKANSSPETPEEREERRKYHRDYWYKVTKPKLLAEREKRTQQLAQTMGAMVGYDPVIELLEEYEAGKEIIAELEEYVHGNVMKHPVFGTRDSMIDVLISTKKRLGELNRELLPYFHGRLANVDTHMTVEDVAHQISDEPLSDDEWNQQYGVAPTNGAAKGAH